MAEIDFQPCKCGQWEIGLDSNSDLNYRDPDTGKTWRAHKMTYIGEHNVVICEDDLNGSIHMKVYSLLTSAQYAISDRIADPTTQKHIKQGYEEYFAIIKAIDILDEKLYEVYEKTIQSIKELE